MITINNKKIIFNNRYRSKFFCKFLKYDYILLITLDINVFNKNHIYTSIYFFKSEKINLIHFYFKNKLNNDISLNIINLLLNSQISDYININKELNYFYNSNIKKKKNAEKFGITINTNAVSVSNTINDNNFKLKINIESLYLHINTQIKMLLDKGENFELENILLSNNNFHFLTF